MAKIYDVYEDFKEEMRNISHFFNLEYHEKNFSNEELVFNLLEQQLNTEKKSKDINSQEEKKEVLAGCVNILQEQNKISKKAVNKAKVRKEVKEKKIKENVDNLKQENSNKEILEKKGEEKNSVLVSQEKKKTVDDKKEESSNIITFLPEDLPEKPKIEKKSFKIGSSSKEVSSEKEKSVSSQESNGTERKKEKSIETKISSAANEIKKDSEKTKGETKTKVVSDKDNSVNPSPIHKDNAKVKREKKVEGKEIKEAVVAESNKKELGFERRYLQDGKYVIEGVNLFTSVFAKKVLEVATKRSNEKEIDEHKEEDKKFKIDCNIDQNLLNGCYWPTQLS